MTLGQNNMTANPDRDAAWHGKDLRHAIDAAGVALWSWNVDTDRLTMDDAAYKLWGVTRTGDVIFEDPSGKQLFLCHRLLR